MSFINTSTFNELSSCLSEKTLLNNKIPNIYSYNLNIYETKNIYNKLDTLKLRGKDKYKNFTIFEKREKEFDRNSKLRINQSLKKYTLNKNQNTSSQNTIYITENIIKGDYTKLPLLLKKMKIYNSKNKFHRINNYNNKIITEKTNVNSDKKSMNKSIEEIDEEKKENPKVRLLFLNKLKYNIEKEELDKKLINKTDSHLLLAKNMSLKRNRHSDKSRLTYIDKLHEFTISKKKFDFKNEQYLQLKENNANKMEEVNDTIKMMHKSQKILEDKFLIKYNDYYRSLIIKKDRENNKDVNLCKYIYSLKYEIKILENKIRKLKNEKNIYVRWMLLQIQIKEKLLNIPKNYSLYLNEDIKDNKDINESNKFLKYKKNIIYKNPQEITKQLERYENENINLIMEFNKINNDIHYLKDEFIKGDKDNLNNYFYNEIINKNKVRLKIIETNKILEKKIISLKQNFNNKNKIKHSKLYEYIKLLKKNIIGENNKKENCFETINEEYEMLESMREIEIAVDKCLKKKKIYLNKYKTEFEEEKEKLEQFKKKERIKLHQKYLHEKFVNLKEKIIKKSNKVYFLPNKKINWRNYKFHNECNSDIDNNKKKEKFIDYIINNINSETELE